jgi:hypothetical protein
MGQFRRCIILLSAALILQIAALIDTPCLNVKTYRLILLSFQPQSVLCAVSTKKNPGFVADTQHEHFLAAAGWNCSCPSVFTISQAETVSVMTDFLVFINECIDLFCWQYN